MNEAQAEQARLFARREAALWLLAIVAVAAALRFAGLTFQSYWFDELFSAYYSTPVHSVARVIELTLADVHPPLYQLGMWLSYKALGFNEFAGRLPSALAGLATIPVIYLLGRELFNSRTGLYAAALATPNYYLLYYAQEARSYALFCLLVCLSFLYFLRSLRSAFWISPLIYVAVTTALLYTHYFAFVVIAIQGCILLVYWFLQGKGDSRLLVRAGVAMLLLAAATIPLVPMITQHAGISNFWITQPSPAASISYFIGYFNSTWLAICIAILTLIALVAAVFRAVTDTASRWIIVSVAALVLWVVLGFMLPWARGLFAQPVITNRNTIMLVPPLLILAAFGVSSIPLLRLQRLVMIAVLGLSFYNLVFGIHYYTHVRKNQYREIATALSAHQPPVPVYALIHNDTKYNIYFEQLNASFRAMDQQTLMAKLEAGTAEPLFWLAGGHLISRDAAVKERFGLRQMAEYAFVGAYAELLLDPNAATRIELEPSVISGMGQNWLSKAPFTWKQESAQLLLALNKEARTGPQRNVQIDVLDSRGHLLETYTQKLGAVPSTMQFIPQLKAGTKVRLVVRMPAEEPEPEIWIVAADKVR